MKRLSKYFLSICLFSGLVALDITLNNANALQLNLAKTLGLSSKMLLIIIICAGVLAVGCFAGMAVMLVMSKKASNKIAESGYVAPTKEQIKAEKERKKEEKLKLEEEKKAQKLAEEQAKKEKEEQEKLALIEKNRPVEANPDSIVEDDEFSIVEDVELPSTTTDEEPSSTIVETLDSSELDI